MADEESPLIKALPPQTDYLTYLTIVEYNLTKTSLPLLHRILQDEALTINIGWDLVHLLLPLLPESKECLQDIARLGNPREVILKTTESLRSIDYEGLDSPDADDDEDEQQVFEAKPESDGLSVPKQRSATEESLPLPVSQFVTLLSMLSDLHPRIKTKYPSRFLSTTLQAILASFSSAASHREEMVLAIVTTIKSIRRIQRPVLPSRKSSGLLQSGTTTLSVPSSSQPNGELQPPAPDPEAFTGDQTSPDEIPLQTKLLQAFTTHVLEEYLLGLPQNDNDVPGMAWCSRVMEKVHPKRSIPGTESFAAKFSEKGEYERRIDALGQLITLAKDLGLENKELLAASLSTEKTLERGQDEEDPPSNAADIPLSRAGSLLLYAAREASAVLYGSPTDITPFEIFPNHQEILKHCLSSPAGGTGTLGTEPQALIDAVLALGLICVEQNKVGEPQSDDQFMEYLQVTALLSSNCPSPNLRGHAHFLTSTVLRSQPDESVRLAFIRDTLEHCPFENLKVSAVAWIKGETIEANPPTPIASAGHHSHDHAPSSESSIFGKPLALNSLAPFLFPSLQTDLVLAPIQESFETFQTNLSFYLASLNFLYLLLQAKHLHARLDIADLWSNNDVAASFMQPLRDSKDRFAKALESGGELSEEQNATILGELGLLGETLRRVTESVQKLNE